MKQIQPLEIWCGGVTTTATALSLSITYDNLESCASFRYALCDSDGVLVVDGSIVMYGQTYLDWGASGDSNSDAYVIAAAQLNLVLA